MVNFIYRIHRLLILFSLVIISIISCSGRDEPLFNIQHGHFQMTRNPYDGEEMRIDGYYYSVPEEDGGRDVLLFYRNGVFIYGGTEVTDTVEKTLQDTLLYIDKWLYPEPEIMKMRRSLPDQIGIFRTNGRSLEMEMWERRFLGYGVVTMTGNIIDQNSLIIIDKRDKDGYYEEPKNLLFHFRQFSPKPDSTSVFIK